MAIRSFAMKTKGTVKEEPTVAKADRTGRQQRQAIGGPSV